MGAWTSAVKLYTAGPAVAPTWPTQSLFSNTQITVAWTAGSAALHTITEAAVVTYTVKYYKAASPTSSFVAIVPYSVTKDTSIVHVWSTTGDDKLMDGITGGKVYYTVTAANAIGTATSAAKELKYMEIPLPPLNISQNIADNGVTPKAGNLLEG